MVRRLWQRISTPLHNDQGAVLVITIFVVALVTILVLEYHYDAAVEIELAENHANDAKAYQLAMSGLNFAKAVLINDTNDYDGPDELWHNLETFGCIAPEDLLNVAKTFVETQLKIGDDNPEEPQEPMTSETSPPACVSLKITDEDSKLPINQILDDTETETFWSGVATQLLRILWEDEESRDLPEDAIGAVMDWIDTREGSTRGGGVSGEDDYYQTLEPPYKTPGRRMEVPGELRMIRFFTCERLAKLFDAVECDQIPNIDLGTNLYLSTFDFVRVNINTAPPALLLAITNNSDTCLEDIETQRKPTEDQSQLLAKPFKSEADTESLTCLKETSTELPELQTKVQEPGAPPPEPYVPNNLIGYSSTYFRVESQAVIDGQVSKKVVAVFHRQSSESSGNRGNDRDNNQSGNRGNDRDNDQSGNQGNNRDSNQGGNQNNLFGNNRRLEMVYFKIE